MTSPNTAHPGTTTHYLKTVNPFFDKGWKGQKTFEIRFNDRGFEPGDILWLEEYDAGKIEYLSRKLIVKVGYVLTHEDIDGLKDGWVVMAIDVLDRRFN